MQEADLMRVPDMRRFVKGVGWITTLVTGWYFFRDWFAPDACMDFGGAFDYVSWRCSHDNNESLRYIEVAAYQLPSFWLFAISCALAVVLQVVLQRPNPGASSPLVMNPRGPA